MEITFLGTSSGAPTTTRSVSATAIKKANSKSWYLVDCGEGTQHQLLKAKLSLNTLKAIFITHVHGDHCYGLIGLISSATMAGRTAPLPIIAPKEIKAWVLYSLKMSQAKLSYVLEFTPLEGVNALEYHDFKIDISVLSHRVPSYAFGFSENNLQRQLDIQKLTEKRITPNPFWGRLRNQQNITLDSGEIINYNDYLLPEKTPRKIIISGDNDQPERLRYSVKKTNVLVHEATFTQQVADKVGRTPQHSSAKMIAEFAEKTNVANLILTHFSSRFQTKDDNKLSPELEAEAKQYYTGNLFLAYDLETYCLDQQGSLHRLDKN
ncbi:MAG: ribonuclease Z [Cocleimonas sp.]|nr:ribonuclease Z [Cocleimonas sp.]